MHFNINLEKFVNDVRKGLTSEQTQILEKNQSTISSIFFAEASNDAGCDDKVLENQTSVSYKFLINKAKEKILELHNTISQNQKYIVSDFDSLSRADNYQKVLDKKVDEILNGKEFISLDELKKHPIFSNIMQYLDDSAIEKFDFIVKSENKKGKVTEKELRLLLAAFDAVPEETSRSGGSRFLGYVVDNEFAPRGLDRVTKKELKEAFEGLMTKDERAAYFKKNKEIYSKYDDANGKITSKNLKSLINDLVATTGLFDKFPQMEGTILKDLSKYEGENWAECFEDVKETLLGSINVSRIAAAYVAESEDNSNKTIDKLNYGGKDIDKKIKQIESNLNIQL